MASRVLIFYAVLISLILVHSGEFIQTPHGLRPEECVIRHNESNATIETMSDGVMIHYPISNRSVFFKSSEKCKKNAKEIIEQYKNRRNAAPDNGGWEIWGM